MPIRRYTPPTQKFISEFEASLAPSYLSIFDFVDESRFEEELSEQRQFIETIENLNYDSREEFVEELSEALLALDWSNIRPALNTCFEIVSVSKNSKSLTVAEGITKKYDYQLKINDDDEEAAQELVRTLNDAGLYSILTEIGDFESFVRGVKVGFESDKRKNRHGIAFENTVERYLQDVKQEMGNLGEILTYKKDESLFIGSEKDEKNEFDYVFFDESSQPKIAFEVNTYSGTGSKPSEVRGNYIPTAESTRSAGVEYVWVTDGAGWKDMTASLELAYDGVTDFYNLAQLRKQFRGDLAAHLGIETDF